EVERQSVATGLQRVLRGGGNPEDRGAEQRAFHFPAAKDDDRERNEAASGGHVFREPAGEHEREVRAAQAREDRLDAEGRPAMQRYRMAGGSHRFGILAAGAQAKSETRSP